MNIILKYCFFFGFGVLTLCANALAGSFDLTILHTNDLHAHLASFDTYGSLCDVTKETSDECQAGSARLAAAIAAERAKGGNILLLDAGDQFQGTLFFTKYKGMACAEMMQRLRYDAMTLGNHEFDEGSIALANFLKSLSFPALAVNLDTSGSPLLSGLIQPYRMLDVNGRKIGVIGVVNPGTPQLSTPEPDLIFSPPSGPVASAVHDLERQGANIIVVLSHLGLDGDRALAEEVAGLDIIVGGHSHVLLANDDPDAVGPCPLPVTGPDGKIVQIVTADYWGRYLGIIHLTFDDSGHVTGRSGSPVKLAPSLPENRETAKIVEQLQAPLKELQGEKLGRSTTAMSNEPCRRAECLPGDLRAEALLEAGRKLGAVAAVCNGGGVRTGIPQGEIRRGDVLAAYPFANTLVVLTLNGEDLWTAIEHGLSALGSTNNTGRFLQVAGIKYVFDSNRPAGERLVSVDIADSAGNFQPLEHNASYRIALSRFLLRGGDGYTLFSEQGRDIFNDGMELSDITCNYIRNNSPLASSLDGRIKNMAED